MRPLKHAVHTSLPGGGGGGIAEGRHLHQRTLPVTGPAGLSPGFLLPYSSGGVPASSESSSSCVLKLKSRDEKKMSFSVARSAGQAKGAEGVANVARLGTVGYGTYFGDGSDGDGGAGGKAKSEGGRQTPNRKGSSGHRSSFFGRLGTKRTEAEPEATVSKSDTGIDACRGPRGRERERARRVSRLSLVCSE